ncbi:MAG TPA: hypothetical protein GX728_04670 [Clostridiaceae bacterium]|nr:hypothetical protein [Clostridiaceae bacterium]
MKHSDFWKKLVILLLCVSISSITMWGCGSKFKSIEVVYNGDTNEGVILDKNNEGFIVTGITGDGKEEIIDDWDIENPVKLERDQTATVAVTYDGLSYEVKVQCSTSELVRIAVKYEGDTAEGTVLSDSNSGFKVTGYYKNNTKKEETNWKIENPQTLKADEHAIVVVTYGDFSSEIFVRCSTSALEKITAKYVGDTTEGTTIRSGDDDVIVTAHYKNGTTERVKDWITADVKTLRAGETSTLTIHYKGEEVPLEIKCSSLSPEQYKAQCESISYNELARNPRKYEGRYVRFTGEVVQAMEDLFFYVYRINVTKKRFFWDDTVYVEYISLDDSMPRVLEDDIVTFYGEYKGLKTYTTIFGGSVTIPYVSAKYIDIK